MDQLTLGLIGGGSVFLLLWYGSRAVERRREIKRLVKGVPAMANSHDPLDRVTANLPIKLDLGELERRVTENLDLFRASPRLLDRFLLKVRSKYSTRWEREMLVDVKELLRDHIDVMKLRSEHAGVARTLPERAETEVYKAKTARREAKTNYEAAKAQAEVSPRVARAKASNELLEQDAISAEHRERREKANKGARDARKRPAAEHTHKPTEAEILSGIRAKGAFQEQKVKAYAHGRVEGELKWREGMRRERDEKIAAVRADASLSEEEKLLRIEEIEDTYAQALARG